MLYNTYYLILQYLWEGGAFLVRKTKDNPIEKKMEREQNLIFENSKEEPLKIAKYIVIVFSFIGIFSSYNQGTFFQNLFPYALLGMYDNYIYSHYSSEKKLKKFIKFSKIFYRVTFFIVAIGYFKLIKIQEYFIVFVFEQQDIVLVRSRVLFLWVVIYYILMGVELYLPIKRGEN